MSAPNRIACAVVLLLAAGAAGAEEHRIVLRVGGAMGWPALDEIYVTSHVPLFDQRQAGTVTQTMPLHGVSGPGLGIALDVGLRGPWRVELLLDHTAADVAGPAGTYRSQVSYTGFPPPSNTPREVTIDETVAWPEATGRSRTLALAANLAWTRAVGPRVRIGASGGLALLRTSGEVQSLGHSAYRLGGHSVLFGDVAEVEVEYGPVSALGADAGAFLEVDLGTRFRARVDGRWFGAGVQEAEVAPRRVRNAEELIIGPADLPTVSRSLAPRSLAVDPGLRRVAVSVGFRF
jgi:hypothetical protein